MNGQAPLSSSQQLVAALAAHGGDSVLGAGFLNWSAFRLTGHIDPGVLQLALDDLVRRQCSLRTIIERSQDQLFQRVQPAAPVNLTIVHCVAVSEKDRLAAVARVVTNALARPQPADRVPVLIAYLVAFDAAESVLVFVAHRSVVDGVSMQIAIRDTMAAYEQRMRRQVPDCSELYQHERVHEEQSLPYWRSLLHGIKEPGIRADRPRPPGRAKALYAFELSAETMAGLQATARSWGSSLSTLLFAAYARTLADRNGGTDVVVPILHAGRDRDEWDTIGCYTDCHLHRLDISGELTLRECVIRMDRSLAGAAMHDVPVVRVLDYLPPAFVFAPIGIRQSIPDFVPGMLVGYDHLRLPLPELAALPADFAWTVDQGGSRVQVAYHPGMFDESSIVAIASHFRQTIDACVEAHAAQPSA